MSLLKRLPRSRDFLRDLLFASRGVHRVVWRDANFCCWCLPELCFAATTGCGAEGPARRGGKHSGNSSKPPSSDIVKPPPPGPAGHRRNKKCKRGGQPGHPRHERPPFAADEIDQAWEYTLDECPDCRGHLQDVDVDLDIAPRVMQQVEIVQRPIRIEEHRSLPHWCPKCQRVHYAPLPPSVVKSGLAGPRLTALVGYLKGACHASFSTIRKLLRDVVGLPISRGQLAKLVQKVSASLRETYEQLRDSLPDAERLNVDETGHPDQGQRLWTWCLRADLYTVFAIDPSRGSDVLLRMLGQEFDGLLGCDYFQRLPQVHAIERKRGSPVLPGALHP